MSQENVELVETLWDAFQRGGIDTMRGVCHANIVIVQPSELPDPKTYVGHEGVKEVVEDWPKEWDDFQLEVLEIIDAGDSQVVSVTRHRGRGVVSGVEVDTIIAYVLTITDGKFARIDMFVSRDQALEAARLSNSPREESN
jgi:ketosteroid isomerase-like protein